MNGKSKRRWIAVVLVVGLAAAFLGLGYSIKVVRTEGFEGLWNRKKRWIESTQPSLKPAVDEVDEAVRDAAEKATPPIESETRK